jgi:hypothetical protein
MNYASSEDWTAHKGSYEGIEVLTDRPAGEADKNGEYPEGTINYLVQKRLTEMAELAKDWKE